MNFQELFKLAMDRDVPELLPNAKQGTVLNLGAGEKLISGTIALDYPDWDADTMQIPFEDETVTGIHAYHFLEHCQHPVRVLQEIQRVLKPGGHVNILVPYYSSAMQSHDLDHKHIFTEDTWRILFGNPYYDKNRIDWQLEIGFNLICGVVERNLCLLTQLIKK